MNFSYALLLRFRCGSASRACFAVAVVLLMLLNSEVSGQTDRRTLLNIDSTEQLVIPAVSDGAPAAGRRVVVTSPEYNGTSVHHALYLPPHWSSNWRETRTRLPIIFEYTGNRYLESGSTGEVKDAGLGFGLSGGKYIWVALPYISADGQSNEVSWWGNEERTIQYAKDNVSRIIEQFGGDPDAVILCGFSRGAIAVNYIGLHDDQIASFWTAFVTHDHFDGVREWKDTTWGQPLEKYRAGAVERLKRVAGRPYLVSQNGDLAETERYIRSVLPSVDNFLFLSVNARTIFGSFPNEIAKSGHTDRWLVKPSEYRTVAWDWLNHGP